MVFIFQNREILEVDNSQRMGKAAILFNENGELRKQIIHAVTNDDTHLKVYLRTAK